MSTSSCYAVGSTLASSQSASISYTSDSGSTWNPESVPSGISGFSTITCPSSTTCYAVGTGQAAAAAAAAVITTNNAGTTWSQRSVPAGIGDITSIACPSTTICYAIAGTTANNIVIIQTSNSAHTWSTDPLPSGVLDVVSIACVSSDTCYAVGMTSSEKPAIITTSNSGMTWSTEAVPSGASQLLQVGCAPGGMCYSVGISTGSTALIIATSGQGTWSTEVAPPGLGGIYAITCTSATTCYAPGSDTSDNTVIAKTTNAGSSWIAQSVPSQIHGLTRISCASDTACTAIGTIPPGSSGKSVISIVATADGGAGWNVEAVPAGLNELGGIACPSSSACYAAGSGDLATGGVVLMGPAVYSSTPSVTTTSLPSGTVGIGYSTTLLATGGSVPYSWSIASGPLPSGLTMNSSGVISGTPHAQGTKSFVAKVTDASNQTATKSLTLSVNAPASSPKPACSATGVGSAGFPGGYWLAGANGAVYSCGNAPFYGSLVTLHVTPAKPIVGIAATPDHQGYWLVASDGGLFAFGDARFYGSMGGKHLNAPIVAMAATHTGGYYEVASDGGLFAFGPGAVFHGSMGGKHLNKPVVGMAETHTGGYYEVASDGGIFAFGAPFHGSTGCLTLNRPIVAMVISSNAASTGTGTACGFRSPQAPGGYQFVASDGGVFSFGNAVFAGSLGGKGIEDIMGIANS